MESSISFFIFACTSLFSIINPFSTAIILFSLTPGESNVRRKKMVQKACVVGASVLIFFTFAGSLFLKFFHISLDSLRLAGSLILIVIGLRMLHPTNLMREPSDEHKKDSIRLGDISIIPLAIPFLSGPGAITTTVVLTTSNPTVVGASIIIAAILLSFVLTYFILANADYFMKVLRRPGAKTVEKIMGLLILCIGMEFGLEAVRSFIHSL